MGIQHEYLNLPFPLQIHVDLIPGDRQPEMRAYSPTWHGLEGRGRDLKEAVDDLLPQISDKNRPKSSCISALRAAGHDESTVEAWSEHITGYRLWALRNDAHEAVDRLARYERKGVPPETACHFLAIGLGPESAGQVHAQGITPEAAAPYMERLGDFWVDHHGEDVPCITAENEREVAQWIMSGFDPDQANFYQGAWVKPDAAARWQATVEKHDINVADLRDIVWAGFTPESVEANASGGTSGVTHVAEAARTMLALRQPSSGYVQGWGGALAHGGRKADPARGERKATPDPWAEPPF